jgi:hypothetical protein
MKGLRVWMVAGLASVLRVPIKVREAFVLGVRETTQKCSCEATPRRGA